MERRSHSWWLVSAVLVSAAVALTPMSALAQEVDNPGPASISLLPGSFLEIGSDHFEPPEGGLLSGSVDADGTLTVPVDGFDIPEFTLDAPLGPYFAKIVARTDALGFLSPGAGLVTMTGSLSIELRGGPLPSGCRIEPIDVELTTGVSGALTGTAYSQEDGTLTLVDGLFQIPTSQGCGVFGGFIDQQFGLPSPSGRNRLLLVAQSDPIFLAPA